MVRKLTIVSHVASPSDHSDKLLAANDVIEKDILPFDLSLEEAPALDQSQK